MYEIYKAKIHSFYKNNKRMPVYSEMMSILGFKSKNSVYKLLDKLINDRFIQKDNKGRLVPNSLLSDIPMLGLVEAGFPTIIEQNNLDFVNLDEYLIKDKTSTYLLEVKGDSMVDAGIQEGDLVVAERKGEPKIGDIVIAEVDGGWTMKYYRKKGKDVYLEPANKKYSPIYPVYDLKIAAIVKGVIRKYS